MFIKLSMSKSTICLDFSFTLLTDRYFENTLMVGNSISIVNAVAGVIGVFLLYKGCQYYRESMKLEKLVDWIYSEQKALNHLRAFSFLWKISWKLRSGYFNFSDFLLHISLKKPLLSSYFNRLIRCQSDLQKTTFPMI